MSQKHGNTMVPFGVYNTVLFVIPKIAIKIYYGNTIVIP